MRLIDADTLNDYVIDTWGDGIIDNPVIWCEDVFRAIHNAPTIDAVPQVAKQDAGKPRLSLVPSQIIWDIAQVREYGNVKYHDPDNWKTVEIERYIDALYRHFLRFLDDPKGKDEESGIEHYKHMACNMAFICEMLASDENGIL